MKYLLHSIFVVLLLLVFTIGASAQSGAKFSLGYVSVNQDFLPQPGSVTGWDMRVSARLGRDNWFFSPELVYQNTNVIPVESKNPFYDTARIHTLKIPIGLGLKFRTTPFQRIFVKAGVMGNYVLVIDENPDYNFKQIKDVYASYYGTIGYDFYKFTIDYRFERSFGDNYSNIDGSALGSHAVSLGINF